MKIKINVSGTVFIYSRIPTDAAWNLKKKKKKETNNYNRATGWIMHNAPEIAEAETHAKHLQCRSQC